MRAVLVSEPNAPLLVDDNDAVPVAYGDADRGASARATVVGTGGPGHYALAYLRLLTGFGAGPHEAQLMSSARGSRTELDDLLTLARKEPTLVRDVDVLPLADAQIAHDRLRAGQTRGRIVLTT